MAAKTVIVIKLTPKLEIYSEYNKQIEKDEFRWRIKMNSKIVAASSEGYLNREDCIKNISKIEEHIKYFRENDLLV